MKLITSTKKLSSDFKKQLGSCKKFSCAVAWASTGFSDYEALIGAKNKIGRAVIGTHFYQTAPGFISAFSGDDRVHFVTDHSGVFHPKIYVFEHKNGDWVCIVGSANFTSGGFGANQEACLLVNSDDDKNGEVIRTALAAIDKYWSAAIPGNKINIEHYGQMRNRFANRIAHASGYFGVGKRGLPVEEIGILNIAWPQFIGQVHLDKYGALRDRLKVLEAARNLFKAHAEFIQMPIMDRQGIAGTRHSGDIPWGWFGSMKGAGVFKKIVNEAPFELSNALNEIPLYGQVSREDYVAYIDRFVRAFPFSDNQYKRHGLATATRLLAMKRPDYFVCLDNANREKLLGSFGVKIANQDYEGYWDKVIERIQLSTWWNARRPTEATAGQIWDGRAAMLDAIYY